MHWLLTAWADPNPWTSGLGVLSLVTLLSCVAQRIIGHTETVAALLKPGAKPKGRNRNAVYAPYRTTLAWPLASALGLLGSNTPYATGSC